MTINNDTEWHQGQRARLAEIRKMAAALPETMAHRPVNLSVLYGGMVSRAEGPPPLTDRGETWHGSPHRLAEMLIGELHADLTGVVVLTGTILNQLTTEHRPIGQTFGHGGVCATCTTVDRPWTPGQEPEPFERNAWPCATARLLHLDDYWAAHGQGLPVETGDGTS